MWMNGAYYGISSTPEVPNVDKSPVREKPSTPKAANVDKSPVREKPSTPAASNVDKSHRARKSLINPTVRRERPQSLSDALHDNLDAVLLLQGVEDCL